MPLASRTFLTLPTIVYRLSCVDANHGRPFAVPPNASAARRPPRRERSTARLGRVKRARAAACRLGARRMHLWGPEPLGNEVHVEGFGQAVRDNLDWLPPVVPSPPFPVRGHRT